MARERSPQRDKAFEMWRLSGGTMKLKDIAAELGVSDIQIRKWKNQDRWEEQLQQAKVTLPNMNSNVTNDKGNVTIEKVTEESFPGQCEATGHKSGERCRNKALDGERFCKIHLDGWTGQCTATSKQTGERCKKKAEPGKDKCKFHGGKSTGPPIGSKNALTHGAYETIWMDQLDDEEQELVKLVVQDKIKSLETDIQLLAIRERRMMKRIANLAGLEYTVVKRKYEKGDSPMGGIDKESEEEQATLGQIQEIERELTKVQAEYTKKIALKHKMEMDIQDMELKREKLELDKIKVGRELGPSNANPGTNGNADNKSLTEMDLSLLTDEELDVLERIIIKTGETTGT